MAHTSTEINLSPTERVFRDMVQHADDFYKIELLRHARSWYTKALRFNMETETIQKKIADCNNLLAFEKKVIWILISIAVLAILAVNFLL